MLIGKIRSIDRRFARAVVPLIIGTLLAAAAPLARGTAPEIPGAGLHFLRPFAAPSAAEIRNALQHRLHRAKHDTAQYTIVDMPGAAEGYGQGTFVYSLNSSGAVTGWYEDWLGKAHGFVRAADGTYQTIDVGKAGTLAGAINDQGAVAGNYVDTKTDRCPGFLVTAKGKTKKFEPPDAATGCGEYVGDLNNNSSISGDYYGIDGPIHAFLRTKNGVIAEFDVPGASNTWGWWMNNNDAIASPYNDGSGDHGYIRAADGTLTTFDAPAGPGRGNIAARISDLGETAGDYFDDNNVVHALLRQPDGTFITYDASDAGNGSGQGTGAEGGVNNNGTVAGIYLDSGNVPRGYIRASDGTLTEFDPPESIYTEVWDINDDDVVAGFYMDTNAIFHGFVRTP